MNITIIDVYKYLALFTIAKIWEQPKFSSLGEWIKKMWYIVHNEYYPAMRKEDILPRLHIVTGSK